MLHLEICCLANVTIASLQCCVTRVWQLEAAQYGYAKLPHVSRQNASLSDINPLNPELNPICYLLALLGAHHFLHVSRIRVKLLTLRLLMPYIYAAPILDVSRPHTTTQHSR